MHIAAWRSFLNDDLKFDHNFTNYGLKEIKEID